MKKSIQLDAMRRDDAKRNSKIDTGLSKRIEKLNSFVFENFGIMLEKDELKDFCEWNSNYNFDNLKIKLEKELSLRYKKRDEVKKLCNPNLGNLELEKIGTTFQNKEKIVEDFISKWVSTCYIMTNGNNEIEKYLKVLQMVVKKQLKYKRWVTYNWEIREMIPQYKRKLSTNEEEAFILFLENDYREKVIELLEKLSNK